MTEYSFHKPSGPMSYLEYEKWAAKQRGERNIVLLGGRKPEYLFFVGIDLGWVDDYTAFAVVEPKLEEVGKPFRQVQQRTDWSGYEGGLIDVVYNLQRVRCIHHVRHLDRVRGRKPAQLADDIAEWLIRLIPQRGVFEEEKDYRIHVAVDATMDWGFIDLLDAAVKGRGGPDRSGHIDVEVCSIRPNHEHPHHSEESGRFLIPRNDLLLQGGRHPLEGEEILFVNNKPVKIPKKKQARIRWRKDIPFRKVLEQELLSFVPEYNINTDYLKFVSRRREGSEHDDLVFALCLAVYFAERLEHPDAINLDTHTGEVLPLDPADTNPPPEPGSRSPLTGMPLPPLPYEST